MREPPVLTTPRLVARLPDEGDAAAVVRYYVENREHLAGSRPLVGPDFYTEAFWRAQAGAIRMEFRAERSVRLFLFSREVPGRVVGNANFTQIQRGAAHYCVLGYGVDQAHEGRGLMKEGLVAGIGYMFDELNLHRVMANYIPWNRRSGGLLRRLGFTVEGYARDYLYLNGRWEDHILTSLTNPNWRPE